MSDAGLENTNKLVGDEMDGDREDLLRLIIWAKLAGRVPDVSTFRERTLVSERIKGLKACCLDSLVERRSWLPSSSLHLTATTLDITYHAIIHSQHIFYRRGRREWRACEQRRTLRPHLTDNGSVAVAKELSHLDVAMVAPPNVGLE